MANPLPGAAARALGPRYVRTSILLEALLLEAGSRTWRAALVDDFFFVIDIS